MFLKDLGKKIPSVFRRCPAGKGGGPWSCWWCLAEVDVKDCLKEAFGFLFLKKEKAKPKQNKPKTAFFGNRVLIPSATWPLREYILH